MIEHEIKIIKYTFFAVAIMPLIVFYGYAKSLKITYKPNKAIENLISVLDDFQTYTNYEEFFKRLVPHQLNEIKRGQEELVHSVITKLEDNDIAIKCDSVCISTLVNNHIILRAKKIEFNKSMTIEDIEKTISGMAYSISYPIEYDFSSVDLAKLKGKTVTIGGSSLDPSFYKEDRIDFHRFTLDKVKEVGNATDVAFAFQVKFGTINSKMQDNFLRMNYTIVNENWDNVRTMNINQLRNWARDRTIDYDYDLEKNIMGIPLELKTIAIITPFLFIALALFQSINFFHLYCKLKKLIQLGTINIHENFTLWTGGTNIFITFCFIFIFYIAFPLFSIYTIIEIPSVILIVPWRVFVALYLAISSLVLLMAVLSSKLINRHVLSDKVPSNPI